MEDLIGIAEAIAELAPGPIKNRIVVLLIRALEGTEDDFDVIEFVQNCRGKEGSNHAHQPE